MEESKGIGKRDTHQKPEKFIMLRDFIFFLLIFSFVALLLTWLEIYSSFLSLSAEQSQTLKKYLFYSASGLLGGVSYDIKYLYRSVARGFWNEDRIIWRLLSPFLATSVSFTIGAMIDASLMGPDITLSSATSVSIGFISGYFADMAVGKMYEVAKVLFGPSAGSKKG